MDKLKTIEYFLLDLDGTIYLGDRLIDGAADFLRTLESRGKKAFFLTNNSSKNRFSYRDKLKRLGIEVDPDQVFTSGEATAIYLRQNRPGAKIFLLGTPLLADEFRWAGFELIEQGEPDCVVLGFDTTLTYEKLWKACDYIREGTPFIATHPDLNCPVGAGKYMPDAGAMIKCIEASTGITPVVIGKPNRYMIDSLNAKHNIERGKIAVVGDRLYTDIRLGYDAGLATILVLSGETNVAQYRSSPLKASYVYPSVKELARDLA